MSHHKRFKTKTVHIGHVPLGGVYPIRVQSMLNTNTLDTEACIKQSRALIESGCEYVRITAPGMEEAENILIIKKKLSGLGYNVPLIADVHFNPAIAEFCARIVEKVRINPGNYADKKTFKQKEYTDADYLAELERIFIRIAPLIKICKEYGTAIRIGTNHGSLSDRIINRYGDTPKGMVESTLEFLRICKSLNFENIVVSLKASNPIVMMQANRLLVEQMVKEDMCYPLHLGVTEAGAGEDGRIKSALGIGTLLKDGIGDTIRVSLTENPVQEIPFAKSLVDGININKNVYFFESFTVQNNAISPCCSFIKSVPVICLKIDTPEISFLKSIFTYNTTKNIYERHLTSPDIIHLNSKSPKIAFDKSIECINDNVKYFKKISLTHFENHDFAKIKAVVVEDEAVVDFLENISEFKAQALLNNTNYPLYLEVKYNETDFDKWLIEKTVQYSPLLINKCIDGFYVDVKAANAAKITQALFGIMQACRVRISKTEYISCPTCGRTSFEMEKTLCKIKQATEHLQGLKIGVMGCIVNGPGEMADADYGYVGNATGKVNLYKGRTAIKKNIEEDKALFELIDILKQDGKWKEK